MIGGGEVIGGVRGWVRGWDKRWVEMGVLCCDRSLWAAWILRHAACAYAPGDRGGGGVSDRG